MTKIIVFGGSGYIGRKLTEFLSNFDEKISVLSMSSKDVNLLDENIDQVLDQLIDEKTIVFLCSGIKKQLGDDLNIYSKNMLMISNFLRSKNALKCKKLIYLSSAEVYGESINKIDIDESLKLAPTSYYGLAKKNIEELLSLSISKENLDNLIIARMPLVYGPNETQIIYGPSGFSHNAATASTQVLWGDGSEKRNFLFIDDLVNVLHFLSYSKFTGVINIANSLSNSFQDILAILEKFNAKLQIEQKVRSKDKVDQGYDISLLKRIYPDYAPHTLSQGIEKVLKSKGKL